MNKTMFAYALLFSCHRADPGQAVHTAASTIPMVACTNVRDFGATGDGVSDDRPAFASAIATGSIDICVPNGTYLIGSEPGHGWGLHLTTPGMRMRGESRDGTILIAKTGFTDASMLLEVGAADIHVESLTVDGNAANQAPSPNMQRHGIRCKAAPRCVMRDVTSRNFTGDGFYVYAGSDDYVLINVIARDNYRDGITQGGNTVGGILYNSKFLANLQGQVWAEGASVGGVAVYGCTLDPLGASNNLSLRMAGSTALGMSSGWSVVRNVINGPVSILYVKDSVFAWNTGTNPTTKPSVQIYRTNDNIEISHNTLTLTSTPDNGSFSAGSIVWSVGVSAGECPGRVVIADNTLTATAPAFGITAICNRDVLIRDNTVTGGGGATKSGIYVRSTRADAPIESALIERNTISGFGGFGLQLNGNGDARILRTEIVGNSFTGGLAAMFLDDGTHAARDIIERGNVVAPGLTKISHPPPVTAITIDGNHWLMP